MINRHFDPYNLFVDPDSRTLLVLNAKVLTKFTRDLVAAGMRAHFGVEDLSAGRYRSIDHARRWPFQPVTVYADLALRPGRYRAYGFVRNPYARLRSAWRNKLYDPHRAIARGELSDYPPSMRKGPLARIRRFAGRRGLPGAAEGSLVPFATFVAFVAEGRDGWRNRHWDLQSAVLQTRHFAFADVFRIEDRLDEGFETVFARVGFPQAWVRARLARPVNSSSTARVPVYTEELAERVYRTFAPDFRAFGYDRESWRAIDGAAAAESRIAAE